MLVVVQFETAPLPACCAGFCGTQVETVGVLEGSYVLLRKTSGGEDSKPLRRLMVLSL
jgi:hypothetical protein